MKNLYKNILLAFTIMGIFVPSVQSMEKDHSRGKNVQKTVSLTTDLLSNVHSVECVNLRKLLNSDNRDGDFYLDQLYAFANTLSLYSQVYNYVKIASNHILTLHELQGHRMVNGSYFIRGMSFIDIGHFADGSKCTTGIRKNGDEFILNVVGREACAFAMQLAPFWNTDYEKGAILCEQFLEHNNKDIRMIARTAKHWFYTHKLFKMDSILPIVLCGNSGMDHIVRTLNLDKKTSGIIRNLPTFSQLLTAGRNITKNMNISRIGSERDDFFVSPTFFSVIENNIQLCEQLELIVDGYDCLYKRVCAEIKKQPFIKKNDKGLDLLMTMEQYRLQQENPNHLHALSTQNVSSSKNYSDDWLQGTNASKKNNNKSKKKKNNTKKKKKGRVRRNKPRKQNAAGRMNTPSLSAQKIKDDQPGVLPQPEKVERSTVSNFIMHYAQRVMRWFNSATDDSVVIEANDTSKLYHSFPLIADEYIFNLGVQTPWSSNTIPGQVDTNYSLGGEIIYPDGTHKTVVFTCCKDVNGVCYHREFKIKDASSLFDEYFKNSKWEVDFPSLEKPQNAIEENVQTYQSLVSDKNYIEHDDSLYVRIHDIKNNVDIVLYKPYASK